MISLQVYGLFFSKINSGLLNRFSAKSKGSKGAGVRSSKHDGLYLEALDSELYK
jgi:hypothetical protein